MPWQSRLGLTSCGEEAPETLKKIWGRCPRQDFHEVEKMLITALHAQDNAS